MIEAARQLSSSIGAEIDAMQTERDEASLSSLGFATTHRHSSLRQTSSSSTRSASRLVSNEVPATHSYLRGSSTSLMHPPLDHRSPSAQQFAECGSVQRERVESILRGFSSVVRPAVSASVSRYDDRASGRSASTSTSRSSAAALQQLAVTTPLARGTVDQVLITESHTEVVELRRALLVATDALHKCQKDLQSEQSARVLVEDKLACALRDCESMRFRFTQLESEFDSDRQTARRDSEAQNETIRHLNRLVEQQIVQLREVGFQRDSWQQKCEEKEDDAQKLLRAVQKSSNEQARLRQALGHAEQEHQRLLKFVDGPLASFARDAESLKSVWSSLEVDRSGNISSGRGSSKTLRAHRQEMRSVDQEQQQSKRGRRLVEKLLTTAELNLKASEAVRTMEIIADRQPPSSCSDSSSVSSATTCPTTESSASRVVFSPQSKLRHEVSLDDEDL